MCRAYSGTASQGECGSDHGAMMSEQFSASSGVSGYRFHLAKSMVQY